ncbi:T9SS type A sorting domain-containing protein [Hymenobacter metallicola]|uniref:T9SS type A sorting domain-containing protein n=1 Tax=Hymenobacter metallicola TaxID=2563114 RepID=A0A4Z0QJ85_9BACT|nr:T9SS type A sorting domain-containing protein [Hymenobacter metallicola]TGE29343.1 T9SS type A sorting domain-containing protein [Hymenobacter metallicola]
MQHPYSSNAVVARSTRFSRNLAGSALVAFLALAAQPTLAQSLNYNVNNAQNLAGTYQDLGTAGTVITTANSDDANSAPQNIGFNFPYNGTSFASFILSTNGFLKLGNVPLSDPFLFFEYAQTEAAGTFPGGPLASTDSRSDNIVAPFSTDLTGATAGGTEYRVATTGTAPNRVCTIQWKNVRDKPKQANSTNNAIIGTQVDNFSFQVKLYESGQIDFVYGSSTAGAGPDAFRTIAIGIKGSTPQTGDIITADKNSTTPWANTAFLDNHYELTNYYFSADPHNVRSSVRPDAGRTYRFRANAATDAAVQAVYTMGQLPLGTPHVVRASVRNAGTTILSNLPVSLDVTGATTFNNTQTIPVLAPGASTTVTFAAYTSGSRLGTNSVAVSVPADTYTNTDVRTETQTLTENVYNYAPLQPSMTPTYYGYGTREGIMATRYTAPRTANVLAVTDFVATGSNSTGQVIQGVVVSSTGTLLGSTAPYTIKASDLGTTITLSFATPVAIPAGDFMAGIAQPASPTEHYPVGLLGEAPNRTGSFFYRGSISSGTFTDAAPTKYGPFMIGAITTNTVTGTGKAAPAVAFALVPNPASSSAQLTLAEAAAAEQQVTLLDALGRPVRTQTLAPRATQATLSVADLPRGVYTVRVGATAQRLVVE